MSARICFVTLILGATLLGCGSKEEQTAAPATSTRSAPAESPAASSPSDYDLQFIDAMSKHHQAAVEMARMVAGASSDPKIKPMAAKMVTDQQKEIDQLKAWRDQWYPNAPAADVAKVAGAASMNMDMSHMQTMKGHALDMMFVDMMIPHHEGAVVMSCEAHEKAQRAEIKAFARDVVRAQETEISALQKWKSAMKM